MVVRPVIGIRSGYSANWPLVHPMKIKNGLTIEQYLQNGKWNMWKHAGQYRIVSHTWENHSTN
jgi:hypothetical protein